MLAGNRHSALTSPQTGKTVFDYFPKKRVLPWTQAAQEIVQFCRMRKPPHIRKEQNPHCQQYSDCKDCIVDFLNTKTDVVS